MIRTNNVSIDKMAVHMVGNKSADDVLGLSRNLLVAEGGIRELLSNYFCSSFKFEEYFSLYHESDLRYNEVYGFVSDIFEDDGRLMEESANLARHLYEKSCHPNIKAGEFYVVLFRGFAYGEEEINAVGLFKSENKDTFLKVYPNNEDNFNIESEKGININKLDKGCLIFNIDKSNGYVVAVVDNTNKGEDAKYWIEDFLHVRPRRDEYYNTHNVLALCKNFVTKELPQQFEVQKADQADLLNRSVQFFKEKDSFDMEEFANEVFAQPEVIDSFNRYKQDYEQDRNLEIADSFTISESAVKKQARAFKSVIKLDRNFHIYVHGNRELIEQGEDEKGKFYKVYYQEEN